MAAGRNMFRSMARFWGVVALGVLIVGCSRPVPPNVLIIVIDTLRADHLGSYGYARAQTPHLDALAAAGTRFANARAPSAWTLPSVASILTGLYPAAHGVEGVRSVLAPANLTIAEALHDAGYESAAFSGNPRFVTPQMGFDQGFDRFAVVETPLADGAPALDPVRAGPHAAARVSEATADKVTDAALQWIAARREPAKPFFLYVHYFDPHAGYFPPPEYAARFGVAGARLAGPEQWSVLHARRAPSGDDVATLLALYDAEVAFTDTHVGRLLDGIASQVRSPTLIVLAGDHGEEFGEHGGLQHGRTLFDEQLRVPLVIAGADLPRGAVVQNAVSLVSIWATIADLAGIKSDGRPRGRSLVGLLRGERWDAVIFADLAWERGTHRVTAIDGRWKLIMDRGDAPHLFDLQTDPGERLDAQEQTPERLAALGEQVQAHTSESIAQRAQVPPAARTITDAERERLRALGYVQ
jgi:arylsulfatase A-like enzyme